MTAPTGHVTAVVPAAGASRRFGGAKLLADIAGQPLLHHTLRALLDGGVPRVVLVVAPDHHFSSVSLLQDSRIHVVTNPAPDRGMFSSIQEGLAAADAGHAVLVIPADMPFVKAGSVASVVAAYRSSGDAVVAASGGRRGHPVIIPAAVWPILLAQPSDTSLKAGLTAAGVVLREVAVEDPGVLRDVDEPRDLDPA